MHKYTPTNASDKMNSQNVLCGFPRSATKTLRYDLAHVPLRKLNRFRAKPINSTLLLQCRLADKGINNLSFQRC